MTLIRLSGVTKTFPATAKNAEPVIAVDDVSLDVDAGEICGIIGYSGAGKSTVLRLVNALETPRPAPSRSTAATSRACASATSGRSAATSA